MEELDVYASSTTTEDSEEDEFYPYIGDEDVEPAYEYRLGGLHPVQLGSFIGGLEVFHKLGYSCRSTTWLCWDQTSSSWQALKILAAEVSTTASPELDVMVALAEFSPKELDDNYISIPSEHFWIDGINGRHLCFISEVLGAHGCIPPLGTGQHTSEVLTDLTYQAAKALSFLHSRGVCHGEVRVRDLAMQLDYESLDEASYDEIEDLINPPECLVFPETEDEEAKQRRPEYLVVRPRLHHLERRFRTGSLCIGGFGRSYKSTLTPRSLRSWDELSPPEVLFTKGHIGLRGPASDIWGLAYVLCEISTGEPVFHEANGFTEDPDMSFWDVIQRMELWLGPLPSRYRAEAIAMMQQADDACRRINKQSLVDWDNGGQPLRDYLGGGRTRSGRMYQQNDGPLSLEGGMENYLQGVRELQYETGWDNHLQEYLASEKQTAVRPDYIHSSSNNPDEYNSDRPASPEAPKTPTSYSRRTDSTARTKTPTRLVKHASGEYPNPKRPCIHYPVPPGTVVPPEWEGCQAEKHWDAPPERARFYRLTDQEVFHLSDLVMRMMAYDPKQRSTIQEVLDHPWFADSRRRDEQGRLELAGECELNETQTRPLHIGS